jgi:hypothetical protein
MKRIRFSFQDGSAALVNCPDNSRWLLDILATAKGDPAEFLSTLAEELQAIFDRSIWRCAPGRTAKPWAFHAYLLPYSVALETVLTIITQSEGSTHTAPCVAVLRAMLPKATNAPLWRIRVALLRRELAALDKVIAAGSPEPVKNEAV